MGKAPLTKNGPSNTTIFLAHFGAFLFVVLAAFWLRRITLQPDVFANDRPRRRTIVLVEDEPLVREATCCILESAGFEVLPPVASLPCAPCG